MDSISAIVVYIIISAGFSAFLGGTEDAAEVNMIIDIVVLIVLLIAISTLSIVGYY